MCEVGGDVQLARANASQANALTGIYTYGYIGPVATAFEVLAEPHRRRILDLLLTTESPVGAIVDAMALSQPLVSKHLRVLREAGLVEARVDAQRRIYRVRAEPLRAMDEWLRPYRRLWAERLDALADHLQTMEDDE
jgi:DNA-binding transcriptional ArsR family regulator